MRPEDLVKGAVRLVSPPDIFLRVSRMVDDPRCSAVAIAQLIARDPALTARLLQIANSPFYGFSYRITTVHRAVTVIGGRGLRDLVLASSMHDVFSRLAVGFLDMSSFWRHSLYCGVVARLLARRCRLIPDESLFVAGQLHDIGQLIILNKLPEMGREAQLRARDSKVSLHHVEREVIGFDHAEVGGELLRRWRLPAGIWESVQHHHAPQRAVHAPLAAAVVHIANWMAAQELPLLLREDGMARFPEHATEIDPAAWRITGLERDEIGLLREQAHEHSEMLAHALLTNAA